MCVCVSVWRGKRARACNECVCVLEIYVTDVVVSVILFRLLVHSDVILSLCECLLRTGV